MKAGHITIRRLKKCVRILESIEEPEAIMPDARTKFCMREWYHSCGSPSCVIGWYASETPERFVTRKGYNGFREIQQLLYQKEGSVRQVYADSGPLAEEFPGLSYNELEALFGSRGCADAIKPRDAVRYIERFIQRKLAEG